MSNLERIEAGLARAREAIWRAVHEKNQTSIYKEDEEVFIPKGSIYRNAHCFHQLSSKHNYPSMVDFLSVIFLFNCHYWGLTV